MFNELFDYLDYREYLRSFFKSLPKAGFGQLSRAAKALGIQPSLFTGILKGEKNLTPEQALEFAHYAGLSELETEYFTTLVQFDRAGTQRLRSRLEKKLAELREKSKLLKSRLPPEKEMPEQAKALFYSEWYYSAIRIVTSVESMQTPEAIANSLGLQRQTILRVLDFLLANNLVVFSDGRFQMGPQSTHIGSGELLVSRHHTNWRLKAIEAINAETKENLHFTSPLSISKNDAETVRKLLTQTIDRIFEIVDPSPAEEVDCLCMDWFKVSKTS
jgi:uncharacterized protein (TIGR02147 family)